MSECFTLCIKEKSELKAKATTIPYFTQIVFLNVLYLKSCKKQVEI